MLTFPPDSSGSWQGSPARDVPVLLDLRWPERLKLDELMTTRYPLPGINQGLTGMRAERNIRGVIVYD